MITNTKHSSVQIPTMLSKTKEKYDTLVREISWNNFTIASSTPRLKGCSASNRPSAPICAISKPTMPDCGEVGVVASAGGRHRLAVTSRLVAVDNDITRPANRTSARRRKVQSRRRVPLWAAAWPRAIDLGDSGIARDLVYASNSDSPRSSRRSARRPPARSLPVRPRSIAAAAIWI